MKEIDEMDFIGFLRVRAYNARNAKDDEKPARLKPERDPALGDHIGIDEAFPML